MSEYDLKALHTKQLMKWRDKCYKFGGSYDPTDNNGPTVKLDEILAELATREHVPSKQEAKVLRQQRAKLSL